MIDTSNYKIHFIFSDETIIRDFATTNFAFTEIYHNDLCPADDSASVTVQFDVALANKLKSHGDENIKVQIKNGAENYLTGYVRKTFSFEKTQRNQPIKLEIVNPSYLLDVTSTDGFTLTSCRVDSVIIRLLFEAGFSSFRNIDISTVIPYFCLEEDGNVKDALEELCKEYGYTFNFDYDGFFVLLPLFNSPPDVITQIFNGSNCRDAIKQTKNEEKADGVTCEWDKVSYIENSLIFSDTENGDATYKCKIQIAPESYLFDTKENYLNYDSTLGDVLFVTDITADIVADSTLQIKELVNCGKKALLSVYNPDDTSQFRITKLDIYGNVYIKVATNKTSTTTGKNNKSITIKYLYNAAGVEVYAKNVINYYRYSDFVVNLTSKIDYPLGSFCSVTDTGIGTIIGRIIQKKRGLLSESIEYEIEGISEYIPATVTTVISVPSQTTTQGEKGETGSVLVPPDLSKCIFCFSMDDILQSKVINNAQDGFATLNGCIQVNGINGSALSIEASENNGLEYDFLDELENLTYCMFVKLSAWGVISQQSDQSYYFNLQAASLTIKPDPSGQIVINQSFVLNTWYLIVYAYSSGIETITIYTYGVSAGEYVIQAKNEYTYSATRDFKTDWGNTYSPVTTGLASGILDEIRLDSYAWDAGQKDAYAKLKGTLSKRYTIGDYTARNLSAVVSTVVPKYLGASAIDPVVSNIGDWYAYSGENTTDRKRGYCYKKIGSNLWAQDDDWDHLTAAMSDLLTFSTDPTAPAITFMNRLISNEAFVNRLASKIITLQNGGTIESENYKTGESGFSINSEGSAEFIGMTAKDISVTGNSTLSDVKVNGNSELSDVIIKGTSLFSGDINSGPLYLSSTQAAGDYHTIPAATRLDTVCVLLASYGYPIVNNGGTYKIFISAVGTYCGKGLFSIQATYQYGHWYNVVITCNDGTQYDHVYEPEYNNNINPWLLSDLYFALGSTGKTLKLTGLPTASGVTGIVYVDSNHFLKVSP